MSLRCARRITMNDTTHIYIYIYISRDKASRRPDKPDRATEKKNLHTSIARKNRNLIAAESKSDNERHSDRRIGFSTRRQYVTWRGGAGGGGCESRFFDRLVIRVRESPSDECTRVAPSRAQDYACTRACPRSNVELRATDASRKTTGTRATFPFHNEI